MHCALLILITCQAAGAQRIAADEASFRDNVAPIFQQRCIRCHNDDDFKGDFSLETRAKFEEAGVVVSGDPGSSHLFEMVTSQAGERPEMPKDAEPLTEEETVAIRGWIVSGAKWPAGFKLKPEKATDTDWWSLQPIKTPPVPNRNSAHAKWVRTPIDAFVLQTMQKNKLTPSKEADRLTLIRRLYFDLIGLPPSPDEVDAFVEDEDPRAYENLAHISQMSCLALACNLRHTLQDKGVDAFHAKVTGEPNG